MSYSSIHSPSFGLESKEYEALCAGLVEKGGIGTGSPRTIEVNSAIRPNQM